MPTAYDFSGRVALVTGAAQGIGRAIANALLVSGARVHVADINFEGLDAVAEKGAIPHHLDIGDRAACHDTVETILNTQGRLDILINGAGGSLGKGHGPIEGITEGDWHAIFDANVNGAFWLSQACAPIMKKARYGRIVNIASGAGLRPALNGNQAYCASKHAIVGVTKQLSFELGPFGVTVNAVAPGIVLSGPWARHQWEGYGLQGQQRVIESLHTRRLGEAEDIAHATLFLAAEDSSWISGQILSADGGRS